MTREGLVRLIEQATLALRWTAEEGGKLLIDCPREPKWAYVVVRLPIAAMVELRLSPTNCRFLADPLHDRVIDFLAEHAKGVALAPEHPRANWVDGAGLFGLDGFSHTYVAYYAVPTHSEAQRLDAAREAQLDALLNAPDTGRVE
jgi:hypothetical protein